MMILIENPQTPKHKHIVPAVVLVLLGVISFFGATLSLTSYGNTSREARVIDVGAEARAIDVGTDFAAITITNCARSPTGAKSSFWTDGNVNHMNVEKRAEVAVELLSEFGAFKRPGRVVDMGSGLLALKTALPEEERHRYIPVDLKERVPGSGTVVCNMNQHEFPLLLQEKVTAFTFLGSFEYVLDKMTVLHLCRMHEGAHIVMVSRCFFFGGFFVSQPILIVLPSFGSSALLAGIVIR
jgi:hypothetical protein